MALLVLEQKANEVNRTATRGVVLKKLFLKTSQY